MSQQLIFRSWFATALFAVLLSLVVAAETRAGTSNEVELDRMAWIDVRDALARGSTTIIIPTGGTEQNGAHMALGKHNFIVRETARQIARQLGDALVAPVISYVPQGFTSQKFGHMAYPGTISLTPSTFEAVLEDAATSFKTHGFQTIVFLGDSGGNQGPQKKVADKLNDAWSGQGIKVVSAEAYYAADDAEAYLRSRGIAADALGTHAGVRDTAELMAVAPDVVWIDRVVVDGDGASGNAALANAELGRALISGKVKRAVAEIQAARSRAAPKDPPGLIGQLLSLFFG